jgi:hypothetical protein
MWSERDMSSWHDKSQSSSWSESWFPKEKEMLVAFV